MNDRTAAEEELRLGQPRYSVLLDIYCCSLFLKVLFFFFKQSKLKSHTRWMIQPLSGRYLYGCPLVNVKARCRSFPALSCRNLSSAARKEMVDGHTIRFCVRGGEWVIIPNRAGASEVTRVHVHL